MSESGIRFPNFNASKSRSPIRVVDGGAGVGIDGVDDVDRRQNDCELIGRIRRDVSRSPALI